MRPDGKRPPFRASLLHALDRLGREIDPVVLAVANEIAPRALVYAEKLLGDPALATDLFEEAAATVSKALRDKTTKGASDIRDMRSYLFQAFLHRLGEERRKEIPLEGFREMELRVPHKDDLDSSILTRELLENCDRVTQEIILHRLEGCSWKEIKDKLGIPIPAATQRYHRAIDRLRGMYRTRGKVA